MINENTPFQLQKLTIKGYEFDISYSMDSGNGLQYFSIKYNVLDDNVNQQDFKKLLDLIDALRPHLMAIMMPVPTAAMNKFVRVRQGGAVSLYDEMDMHVGELLGKDEKYFPGMPRIWADWNYQLQRFRVNAIQFDEAQTNVRFTGALKMGRIHGLWNNINTPPIRLISIVGDKNNIGYLFYEPLRYALVELENLCFAFAMDTTIKQKRQIDLFAGDDYVPGKVDNNDGTKPQKGFLHMVKPEVIETFEDGEQPGDPVKIMQDAKK